MLELRHGVHGAHPPHRRAGDAGHELRVGVAVQRDERAGREHAHDGLARDVTEARVRAGELEQPRTALRVAARAPRRRVEDAVVHGPLERVLQDRIARLRQLGSLPEALARAVGDLHGELVAGGRRAADLVERVGREQLVGQIVGEAARRSGVARDGIGNHLRGTIRVAGFRCGRGRRRAPRAPCRCLRAARRRPTSSTPAGRGRQRRSRPRARAWDPSSWAARRRGAGSKGERLAAVLAAAGSPLATARSIRRSAANPGTTHSRATASTMPPLMRAARRGISDPLGCSAAPQAMQRDDRQRDRRHLPVPVHLRVREHAGGAHSGTGERGRRLLAPAQQACEADCADGAAEQQPRQAERGRELLQLPVGLCRHLAAVPSAQIGRPEAARAVAGQRPCAEVASPRPSRSPSGWTPPTAGAGPPSSEASTFVNEWKALRDAPRRVLLQRDAGQQHGDDRRGHGSAAAERAPALRRDRDALIGDCDGSADGRDEDAAEQEPRRPRCPRRTRCPCRWPCAAPGSRAGARRARRA